MRIFAAIAISTCALLLSGCVGAPVMTSTSTVPTSGAALRGRVHGGQNPIMGAHVYLLAVNTTGYGSASASLLTSGVGQDSLGYYVTTDSNGDFTITGDYTCPTAYSETYVYAVGGNPGSGANSAATLLSGVDGCNSSDFVVVNEVSTIASVYAFAGFAVDPTHASSSNSTMAQTGLYIAGQTVGNLYTQNTGVALATTPAGNGTVPQAEINTLANILAACVNSAGPTSTACTTLFSNAKNGSTAPTDTATAALNIAHNPGANIANLFGLQTPGAPFQPSLPSTPTPNDFTIAISYTGGGLDGPFGIAIDASGNVWATNYNHSGDDSISEFSPAGVPLSGSTGYTGGGLSGPQAIAIDSSGDIWATNGNGTNSISELSSTGMAISGMSGGTGGGLNVPVGIAIDKSGNVWVANVGNNSISEFNSSGMAVSGASGDLNGGLETPSRIAVDTSGNVWVANPDGISISEFNSSTGLPVSSTGYTGGGLSDPTSIAIDAAGNVWLVNYGNNSLSEFTPSNTTWDSPTSTGDTGGGLDYPYSLAIDGAGDVWAVNTGSDSISEFNSSGSAISGSKGYIGGAGGVLANSQFLAIDDSGNVWVTNIANNTIVEFVGAATPVVTPIVANLLAPYGAHAVNKP